MRRSRRTNKAEGKPKTKEKAPPPPPSKDSNRKGSARKKPKSAVSISNGNDEAVSFSSSLPTSGVANPLENAVILNHLFQLCPSKLLATCRLVSKLWYQESLVTWRTSFPLAFTLKNDRIFLIKRFKDPNRNPWAWDEPRPIYTRLQKFLNYTDNPGNQCSRRPYRYFKIVDCYKGLDPDQFQPFWNDLGSNVTRLELNDVTFDDTEQFRTTIYTACPNLQRIGFDNCFFPEPKTKEGSLEEYEEPLLGKLHKLKSFSFYDSSSLPISWMELFAHFQSITHFTFSFSGERNNEHQFKLAELEGLMKAIRVVRKQDSKALPFQSFIIHPIPTISTCSPTWKMASSIVRELRLPLKWLGIRVEPEMDEAVVRNELEFHSKTVAVLKLRQENSAMLIQSFPFEIQLDHLQKLDVEEGLCEDLNFLKYTPSLEELVVTANDHDAPRRSLIVSNSELGQLELKRLRGLKLNNLQFSEEDLAALIGWMPNVNCLEMILNDKQFQLVCKKWTMLTVLRVQGRELTDAGITGINPVVGKKSGSGRKGKKEPEPEPPEEPSNITNLQRLEEFAFWSPQPTAQTLCHFLLQLPHLLKIASNAFPYRWGKAEWKALEKRKIVLRQRSCCGFC